MSSTRWQHVEELFHRAADLKGEERLAFLDSACGDDRELRRELESLLAADDEPGAVVAEAVAGAAVDLAGLRAEDATLVGKRIGRYAILEMVGKGGMGAVYRAVRDDEVRMEVAIKLLKRGTDTDAALRHFRRERQILAALQHPNIARLLDAGATEDGLPYFVMEFVDGRPLLDYASGLPVRKRLELFRAICSAVQYAHQNLVVHRDLKPGNILVTEDGTPKLLDFGIAKLLDRDAPEQSLTVTAAGARLLTPDYASPEQVRGEAVTTVSDVYSLGVVLHELLTGERPYRIETHSPAVIEEIVCRQPPRRASAANPQVDEDLDTIVLMALRKEPARRYASAEQFSEDIRRYLEGKPVRARKDTLVYHTSKFVRRNRLAVAVATMIVAGLLAGVVVVRRQARRAEYRFQQVRKLAATVLFNLEPEIEPLAGSTKAREVLVNTSLEYLDSLANEAENDPELQLELATAYEKIGDVQGNSRYSNLGHPEAAVRSYEKALAIAAKLKPTAPVLKLIAETHYKMGSVQYWGLGRSSDAMENLRMATRVADSIPQQTSDPAYRVRAEAYGFLGDTTAFMDSEQAREPLGIALKLAREWVSSERTPPSRYFLALSLERWGTTLMGTGDLLTARDSLFEAAAILQDLLKQQPDNAVWKRELGVVEERIGMVEGHPQYFNLGDSKSAAEWFQKLVAGEEQLLAADADNLRAREDLSEALADLAASLRDSDPARAERLYRRSFELSESFLAANPGDWEAAYNQSFDRIGFASALRREGKQGQAAQEIDRPVRMLGVLVQRDAANPDSRQMLASALQQRAVQRLDQRNVSGAERDLGDALELLESLHRSMPRRLTVIRDLADCYQTAGDVDASRSDWGAAETEYRKSMELWDSWKTIGVSSSYDHLRRERAAKLVARATSHKKSSPP